MKKKRYAIIQTDFSHTHIVIFTAGEKYQKIDLGADICCLEWVKYNCTILFILTDPLICQQLTLEC